MMLAILGLLFVPLPAHEDPQVGISVERPAPELGVARPQLRDFSHLLEGLLQTSRQAASTGHRWATPSAAFQPRSTGRHVAGAIIGAVAGFFAGGYIGANVEPDCACDDPGLKGFLIGAPIGAIAGGILGGTFF